MERHFDRVFFDLTGTLLRVRGSVGAVYATAAARHGVHATPERVDRYFRAALATAPPACFPGIAPEAIPARERAWWREVVARAFAPLGHFAAFDDFFAEVFAIFARPEAWELLPHAQAALAALQSEGRKLGVVSEMDARVYAVLEGLGLRNHFDVVVLSTECGAVKTDGGLFRVALQRTGDAPAHCVHVGDSLAADAGGARSAGITAILLGAPAAPPGVRIAADLAAIPDCIRALERDLLG